jgi:hypothetical protein
VKRAAMHPRTKPAARQVKARGCVAVHVARDARGRFTAPRRRNPGARGRRRNPEKWFKVAFDTGGPVAEFRSLPRARQYAQALAQHTRKRVRLTNPARRGFGLRPRASHRGLVLTNPSRYVGGESGKYVVAAVLKRGKGRPVYMGWTHDEVMETRKQDAMPFATKAFAFSEAKRMGKLFPNYVWGVERV